MFLNNFKQGYDTVYAEILEKGWKEKMEEFMNRTKSKMREWSHGVCSTVVPQMLSQNCFLTFYPTEWHVHVPGMVCIHVFGHP